MANNKVKAICVLDNNKIKGVIKLEEDIDNKVTIIDVYISGLTPNSIHGFHIHEKGNLLDGCQSLCKHFNPFNAPHGSPADSKFKRHVGDLGNLTANSKGIIKVVLKDKLIKLNGKYNVIGRSFVLHEEPDDLGRGMNDESLKTGNSGKRIACGIIGYA